MRICLISSEILGWGPAGGFGFATRSLGRELVARGIEVTAIIPRPRGVEGERAELDGIRVLTYPRGDLAQGLALFRECRASVFHSQEPSLGTWLAQRAHPDAAHIVTSRDPRMMHDWWLELRYPTYSPAQVMRTAVYYENPLTRLAVRRALQVFVPAKCLARVVQRKYALRTVPSFLPTPIRLGEPSVKASEPTVCYVGRLDRRKRPERALALAEAFPEVRFIICGVAQDKRYGDRLMARYGGLPNIEMRGFVNQFAGPELSEVLGKSWILINTSPREGLPNSFIEAAGHGTAILSAVDPDGFASDFGEHVNGEDYASALERLLTGDAWRVKGARGRDYVRATNAAAIATERHIAVYRNLFDGRSRSAIGLAPALKP